MGFNESQISPIAEGAARATEVRSLPWTGAGVNPGSMFAGKGGGASGDLMTSGSNWGLLGPTLGTALIKGGMVSSLSAGAQGIAIRIPLVTTKPAIAFTWPRGLFVWEMVLAWNATVTTGKENGFVLCFTNGFGQPITAGNPGIVVGRQTNGLRVTYVNTTTTTTDVVATLSEFNKIRIELRNATKTTDASCRVFLNDVVVSTLDGSSTAFPVPAASPDCFLNAFFGVLDAAATVYWRDVSYWDGPDVSTALGM